MLASDSGTWSIDAMASLRLCIDGLVKHLAHPERESRRSIVRRYLLALLVLALSTSWLLLMDPSARLLCHEIFLLMIGVTTTAILGAGPSMLAISGLMVTGSAIVDMDMNGTATNDFIAVLCALVLANGVALRSTFWRVRAEQGTSHAIRLAEQLKLITDGTMHYALYMTDPAGRIVHWNHGAERYTGRREAEVIDRHITALYDGRPEMADLLERTFALAAEHGGCEFDCEFTRRNGTSFVQNCVVTALHDEDGGLRGFSNLARDVTQDREREHRSQEREAELGSILGAVPDAVLGIDESGRIDYVNETAERVFGYHPADLRGKDFNILLSASQPARQRQQRLMEDGETHSTARRLIGRRADGSNFPIEMTFVKVERMRKVHSTAFIRDLTEQEATKARLEQLRAEMLHGTRYSAMGAMASMLSHELNQPLTAVAAYMEGSAILLKREKMDRPKLERAFRAAAAEAVRAGAIMRRLRSFVSDGEAQLEVHDIEEIVESSVGLVSAAAEAAGVYIAVDVGEDAGPIFADPIQIQQVIGNLCRNAIDAMRDSPERLLTLQARQVDEMTTNILIRDTGPGVPPEIQDRIFDAFVSHKPTGTGVGLSICRTIVEAHGGHIWVSTDATGSCFGFSLKRQKGV
ncbi:PAS domain-containing sensor histidine kinase [Sphingobium bisphenolivorans]|uniref:PAS domain-containing sensor histidine kinase n=1 Tax=Sphingobium bisphenolivorans TaxID=1335760 RepID=UPI0003A84784|nr:PAS domain-containing sensor histidine kinase [Sphingobium bisphenolivorans]